MVEALMEEAPSGPRRVLPLFGDRAPGAAEAEAPAEEARSAGEEIIHRVGGNLPRSVLIAANERAGAFYAQELAEADQRGWPPEMKVLYERALENNAAALAELQQPFGEVIPIDREAAESLQGPVAAAPAGPAGPAEVEVRLH
jgi:hypothetical protein